MGSTAFSDLSDQVNILKTRKMVFNDEEEAKYILLRENYYNVINGYKKPFLKKDLAGINIVPEEYIDNCNFSELYGLCCFDRELRILLLDYLLKFETHFKSFCGYHFSDKFRDNYAYLAIGNYSKDKTDLPAVLSNIATLSKEIKQSKSLYINHYIKNYDSVPLWVLVNSLTIGNMSYFYSAIDILLKEIIAKEFSSQYKNNYNCNEKIGSDEMQDILKIVNLFRNVCAHDEVLYLFKLDKPIKSTLFTKFYQSNVGLSLADSNLYTLVLILKLVLPKIEFDNMTTKLDKLFFEYELRFKSVRFGDIIKLSGFNTTWKTDLI